VEVSRWHLRLDPSAIKDGTYADLHRGQQGEFAVAVEFQTWDPSAEMHATMARIEGGRYDLVARVVATGDDWWVLDCGLAVGCRGRPPAGIEVGRWVRGRADLGLSPHPALPPPDKAPPLTHTWFVERIHRRTGPDGRLGDLDLGLQGLHGGPEEPGWEEVGFTDAWHDNDGDADYLVECLLVRPAGSPA